MYLNSDSAALCGFELNWPLDHYMFHSDDHIWYWGSEEPDPLVDFTGTSLISFQSQDCWRVTLGFILSTLKKETFSLHLTNSQCAVWWVILWRLSLHMCLHTVFVLIVLINTIQLHVHTVSSPCHMQIMLIRWLDDKRTSSLVHFKYITVSKPNHCGTALG